ncbi:DNA-binding transcriptional LysR family regulator [Pseudoduganella flava]|uniref:DNA-binding transcriptional LysR family regulator n=1 Tax=Pseudoduganella flava TaxID=871742 RepID=A0A562PJC4_9BURK|nr:LysR family transcriptional regulator [Pseudoduganella flava]QGZ42087.1 LysR family transcriptional regulator [Pseudoduganella flava]TWI44519.1 DNA-binding transcriptional LysR family regulator [Pseudoduganella flava]
MVHISERDFRGVDLNLLVTFLVLMRERSVSKAAQKLFVGQPAASAALARLRELFDDQLLVRTPAGMVPTPRALALEAELAPLLERMQAALFAPAAFDPAAAEHTLTIGMPDWAELWLMPGLFERVRADAPGVRLAVQACDPFSASGMLERGEIDAYVGALTGGPGWQRGRRLRTMTFRCLYNPALLGIGSRRALTAEQYAAHPHVLVSYRGAFESAADERLAALGLTRHVRFVTPRFATVPELVRRSPVIGTVPDVLARQWDGGPDLTSSPVPFDLPGFIATAHWHARRDRDPALGWLLDLIRELTRK